jgi:hypothetical protein
LCDVRRRAQSPQSASRLAMIERERERERERRCGRLTRRWRAPRLAESLAVYADCLRLMELALGEQHLHVAAVLNNLAGLSVQLSRSPHPRAEALYARALTIIRAHYGAQHPR